MSSSNTFYEKNFLMHRIKMYSKVYLKQLVLIYSATSPIDFCQFNYFSLLLLKFQYGMHGYYVMHDYLSHFWDINCSKNLGLL